MRCLTLWFLLAFASPLLAQQYDLVIEGGRVEASPAVANVATAGVMVVSI